jgi:transcriptional regulator with XRE-family HTH domain
MSNKELGERVRAARMLAGLTQTELGQCLGLAKGKISLIENGKRGLTAREAVEIARAVKRSVGDLLADDRPRTPIGGGCVSFELPRERMGAAA